MKKITKLAFTILILNTLYLIPLTAQVGINNDNSEPDASAMLDVKSSDKGMLVPRMDSTARNAILTPAVGLLVYDSTTTSFWYYDEMQWNEIRNGSQTIGIQDLVENDGTVDCLEEKASLDVMFSTSNVVIDGDYAYVIGDGSMKIIDITNPKQLVEIGSIATTSSARFIDVANNYAYTVDENQEAFNVIDVRDVNNLSIVGTLDFGTDPMDVVVSGNYAYVLDPGFGLVVIDVSDPTNPTQVNTFGLGGGGNGMALANNNLYIVDRNSNDLRIINISNPLSLSLTGSLVIGDFPTAVAVLGDYAYVVDSNSDDLKVINISNPSSPVLSSSLAIGGKPSSVAVTANTVYVVDTDSDDIKAIDVSNPSMPTLQVSLPIGANPNAVVTNGNFAYVVDSGSDDLKSIGACSELLSVDVVTGDIMTTPIEEITAISSIKDADEDTKIQVEETEDEDVIRFDISGEEKFVFTKTSNNIPRLELISPTNNFSIFIGDDEIGEMSTGHSNIAIGHQALKANTSGRENIAIGTNALFKNSNSIGNYAIGHGALNENLDGNSNVAIATGALRRNTSGSGNIGIGASAGFYNTTGNNNILIGESAGGGFSSEHAKSNNVMIGDEAGLFNQGSSNVFLGYNAGYGENGSNKLYIENSSANANNALIYGEFDNDLVRINGDLEVTGSFPGSDDQSLSFDGANLSIEDGNSVDISSIDTDTDDQTLSFDGINLSIADGNSVDISSIDTDTDDQTLSFDGANLSIADGNAIDISSIDTDTDDQTLSFDGTNISIADGNSVNLSSLKDDENWEMLGGTNITNVNEGNVGIGDIVDSQTRWQLSVRDTSSAMLGTDSIDVSGLHAVFMRNRNENNTGIGIGFQSSTSVDVVGAAIVHERTNNNSRGKLHFATKASGSAAAEDLPVRMTINETGNVGIGTVNPNQKLHVVGNIRMEDGNEQAGYVLTSDANGVGTWQENVDTDDQTLSFNTSNDNLSIVDGNSIDISGVDDQTLSFDDSNNTLSIADGNSVDLSSLSSGVPVGTIQMWVTDTPPTDWLICDGSTFNTTTYPELNTLLNSNKVPDLRKRFPLGAQNIVSQGDTPRPLKSTGGEEEVTLNLNQIPAHTHGIQYREGSEQGSGNDYSDLGDTGVNDSTQSAGGDSNGNTVPHNNMPPYYAVHFIIKAK